MIVRNSCWIKIVLDNYSNKIVQGSCWCKIVHNSCSKKIVLDNGLCQNDREKLFDFFSEESQVSRKFFFRSMTEKSNVKLIQLCDVTGVMKSVITGRSLNWNFCWTHFTGNSSTKLNYSWPFSPEFFRLSLMSSVMATTGDSEERRKKEKKSWRFELEPTIL